MPTLNFGKKLEQGSTLILVSILILAVILLIGLGIAGLMIKQVAMSKGVEDSMMAYFAAEAGANEAILALLRNPSYSGGTLSLGDSIATITVSGNPTLTIVSSGENNGFVRKVQVTGTYSGNSFAISSWSEIN